MATYKSASNGRRPANLDLILITRSRTVGVQAAARSSREEEVVVIAVLDHVRALFSVRTSRVESERAHRGRRFEWRVGHVDLVEIAPERTEVHVVAVAILDDLAINCVVIISCFRRHSSSTKVFEGIAVHRGRCRQSNGAVLTAERAHGVGDIVCVADLNDIWSPEVLVSSKVDAGAGWQHRTLVGPGTRDGRRGVDSDLVAGRETEVGAIRLATDDGGIMGIVTDSRTSSWSAVGRN